MVDGWNRAKAIEAGKTVDDGAPDPTDDQWIELKRRTAETLGGSVH